MKKRTLYLALSIIMLLFSMAPAMAASTRASDYISRYSSDVKVLSDSEIAIWFSIYGTDEMDCLGAEKISIYENLGNRWRMVELFERGDTGMSETDTYHFQNVKYFSGEPGTEYKISIVLFAESGSGYDSRTRTHYITA
ncbi:MAG: hypothetical protein HFF84_09150 [Oscillibacter sp.]|nr:hypothetical protein [Oscillibacter sp.]